MKYGVLEETIKEIKAWLGSGSINIFGMPFSGKDTQGKRLAEILDAPLIGGGDIIRNSSREDIKRATARGALAPTQDYLDMVTPYLAKSEFSGRPLVLSSVGRWNGEEQVIQRAAHETGHPQKAVILLSISEDDVRSRHEAARTIGDRGRREDDATHVLDTRLEEFRNKTKPVIDYYASQGLLIEVDGTKKPDEVTLDIFNKLSELAETNLA